MELEFDSTDVTIVTDTKGAEFFHVCKFYGSQGF
jgi:hypothetical protein